MNKDMEFATEMLAEIQDYNLENGADGDDDLLSLDRDLTAAIDRNDAAQAAQLARESRRFLIANGYADDDELPSE